MSVEHTERCRSGRGPCDCEYLAAQKLLNFVKGLDAAHEGKLSRSAAAFAALETELESMLPAGSTHMQAISKMLEVASMTFGAAISQEARSKK